MGLLGDIFSTIDSKKRQLRGLLADPVGEIDAAVRRFRNDQRGLLDTFATGYQLPGYQSVLTTPQQVAAARKAVADQGADMGMAAATVWHGSPHKFDKFDSSKIGTGEGAQAYGHGLYLAESPEVAKSYADSVIATGSKEERLLQAKELANKIRALGAEYSPVIHGADGGSVYLTVNKHNLLKNGKLSKSTHQTGFKARFADHGSYWGSSISIDPITNNSLDDALAVFKFIDNPKKAPEITSFRRSAIDPRDGVQTVSDVTFNSNVWANGGKDYWRTSQPRPAGHLYKVDLPDDQIAKMLDWDKPLSQQAPEVRAMAESALRSAKRSKSDIDWLMDKPGAQLENFLMPSGNRSEASQRLSEAGIPGIRYLDGGSRGAGTGTSNFVIFPGNEGLLTILERNGQMLTGN